ncbi:fatty-acyl-CoA synthase [Kineosphaera limosa]|uniref:Putative fatty-acid--CoA ligase n=1 Tax=Kineosphaera limosa NBRC 100340 TaxID=1184609 RepID=K6XHE2_9MICO|nr:acyl--CoA ligase family protein [Kineosphaera limosa]NYE01812.1 fatty-acyl-CoA synthase [Kineosphaera limosa]GAB98254.1 putative fatty-acid--CoA ligase [Kineosphaera limosa NBRC 100340]
MERVNHTPLSPLSFLARSAAVWPDKQAVVYGDTSWTYREFADEVQVMARALAASGVEPGDRVAYVLPNVPQMLAAHYAVPALGAVLVAVNTRLSAEEIAYLLEHSQAKVVVVDGGLLEVVARAVSTGDRAPSVTDIVLIDDEAAGAVGSTADRELAGDRLISLADFRDRADRSAVEPQWGTDDEERHLCLNYTSGTTGRPKGVLYTHRGAYLNSFGEIVHSGFTRDTRYLWTLPMFHCNGWCTTWAITAIGGTHVCLREVRGDVVWRLLHDEQITHLNGAPTVLTTIANAPERTELERPVTITTAGAPPAPATILGMEDLGFRIVHVYGLTEVYGPYSVCEPQDSWADLEPQERARIQARQGVGMVQADRMRVVDPEMNDVPADGETMGEIAMRGNNLMAGYYRDAEGTAAAFSGGWFHTGDLGVMHPDGYVELRDRAKDVVISGGESISTVEVEQALMSHPDVLEVAVIGVPDEKWGERPKGFVKLKEGAAVTPEELIEHVKSKIARYKAPKAVDFVVELPKTSTGKIQKFALRDAEWGQGNSRIQG